MKIKEAAILREGVIWTGRRHCDVINKIIKALGKKAAPIKETQGFVTECGKFVDRKEAAKIAFESGQMSENVGCLMSEDLY